MAQDNPRKKELQERLKSMPAGAEKDFWSKVLAEMERYEIIGDEGVKADLEKIDREITLSEERIEFLEKSETERNKESARLAEEAKIKREKAEKEWREAVAAAVPELIEADVERRRAEAAAEKEIAPQSEADLFQILKDFLGERNLAGCGAVLRKLAVAGRLGNTLNYFGYPSNAEGLNRFLNELVIGEKPVLGEKAFENFIFQQNAYALEQDLSCLAGGNKQWSLAFAMGRKGQVWYQLSEEEHLIALAATLAAAEPGVAARKFGRLAYGFDEPREKFNPEAGSDFFLGPEGKLVLLNFADDFDGYFNKNDFNPEAAELLKDNFKELETLGLKTSFVEALNKNVSGTGEKSKEDFAGRIAETERFGFSERADDIASEVYAILTDNEPEDPDIRLKYEDVLLRARLLALPTLPEREICDLAQNNFVKIFEIADYDFWEKLKTKLISIPQFEARDALKKKIRDALLLNSQTLTKQGITTDSVKIGGTVKNWLSDYHQAVGTGKAETIKMSQYLVNSPNTKNLDREDKRKLEYLIKVYERLKLSSMDLEGIEETTVFNVDGEIDLYSEGRIERVSRDIREKVKRILGAEKIGSVGDEIQAKYRGDEAEAKKVEAEMKKIQKAAGRDAKKLVEALYLAIPGAGRTADKIRLAAVLRVLAENGQLTNLLEEKKFSEMMTAYFKEHNKKTETEGFNLNPKNPEYLAAFLKYVLVEKAGMSEDESGRIVMQIFNILAKDGGEKYQGLVYFDLEDGKFKWS
jgi:hypothetical protein